MESIQIFVANVVSRLNIKTPFGRQVSKKEVFVVIENNKDLLDQYTNLLAEHDLKTVNLYIEKEVSKHFQFLDSSQEQFVHEYTLYKGHGILWTYIYNKIKKWLER